MLLRSNRAHINDFYRASVIFTLAFFVLNGVICQCNPSSFPFQSGERLDYDVYYHLKKMWVPAGKVRFEVKDSIYNGIECFHFDGKGKSLKSYDYFFKVRDHYASLAEKQSLRPVRFVRKVNEGGFSLYYDYRRDHESKTAKVYSDPNDSSKNQEVSFPDCVYDVITAVYFARTLSFDGLKENDVIPLPMMVDKQIYDKVYVRYTGKSRIKGQDGEIYSCIKFRPLLIEGTIFEDGEYMEVFVTDDKNHIPIFIEAEILVGSIKAYLTSWQNLKYPLDARGK